jgi:hypothetical protein
MCSRPQRELGEPTERALAIFGGKKGIKHRFQNAPGNASSIQQDSRCRLIALSKTAVDANDLTIDPLALRTHEKCNQASYVFCCAQAVQWR